MQVGCAKKSRSIGSRAWIQIFEIKKENNVVEEKSVLDQGDSTRGA